MAFRIFGRRSPRIGEKLSAPLPPFFPTAVLSLQIAVTLHFIGTDIIGVVGCTGSSMLPTLHQGDWLLTSPLPYCRFGSRRKRRPKRGDLIFAASPMDPSIMVSKRVIGVEGDLIEVDPRLEQRTSLYGIEENEKEKGTASHGSIRYKGTGEWVRIPKGYVWLAGDNMSNSNDSRSYGPIPVAMIKGKVLARVCCIQWIRYQGYAYAFYQVWPGFKWFSDPVQQQDEEDISP